jgi:uncharacterized protein YjeT (DUF2065 family)
VGRGRQVIGGTLHADLTPADVREVILDGFFPIVSADAVPQRGGRTGLHEMGLPYVSDPAISRHLADFLRKHLGEGREAGDEGREKNGVENNDQGAASSLTPRLAAVLFNGGVFTPALLRNRVVEVLLHWFNRAGHPWQPLVLTNPSLDLAVAWGAAYFAWLKHTGGRRIGGGMARSYYVGIQGEKPAEDEGSPSRTVLCVVPQHLEEGQEIALEKPELDLALGQPVSFPLYTSTVRASDKPGDLLNVSPSQLWQLPPLHTILRGGKRSGTKNVRVTLAARCTEIGTLELWCVAKEGNNRWRLEFNVRDIIQEPTDDERRPDNQVTDVWPEEYVQDAARLLRTVYGKEAETNSEPDAQARESLACASGSRKKRSGREGETGRQEKRDADVALPVSPSPPLPVSPSPPIPLTPQNLTKAMEASLQAGRDKWPTGLCRRMWEFLAEVADQRRTSPAHLSRWYNLTGFCLRPGFGDPLDKFRVEQLWKMLNAINKPGQAGKQGVRQIDGGADYWIMWRRVAGGLSVQLQNTLYQRLKPVLVPAKGKNVVKPGANELTEMWRAIASLERLDVKQKDLLGQAALKICRRSPVPSYGFFALTRLGARVLLYGPFNAVLHPEVVQGWIDAILPFEPGNDSERLAWAFCLTQLARRSGQRALDVDDGHRQSVLKILGSMSAPGHWSRMVQEVLELESEEQSRMFGEALPIGLRLAAPPE